MRYLISGVLAACSLMAPAAVAQYGPITITGTVESNTLVCGQLVGVTPGTPVRMFFRTLPGGFNPRWGSTGRFVHVDEASFELHVGTGTDERVLFSEANNTSILFIQSGYVTTVVHDDEMEFFQMALDSAMYHVYFKTQDSTDTVWNSPLICFLPTTSPASAFDFKRWEITDFCGAVPNEPGPIMRINFDGAITVPCAADTNGSGAVSIQDLFDFLAFYFANDARADFNGSGTVSIQDIFDFLAGFFHGCPA